jgi:hypothetical protein
VARKTDAPAEIPASFAPVVAAFARARDVALERGWGAGNLVLKVGGKIFVMLHKGALVAKLPRERVDGLVAAGKGVNFDPGRGRLMKEWLVAGKGAPPWVELAREAHRFVSKG